MDCTETPFGTESFQVDAVFSVIPLPRVLRVFDLITSS